MVKSDDGFITLGSFRISILEIYNGHYPSSRSDAEKIFDEILRHQISYTTNDIKSAKVNLPKPTARYITLLIEKTKEARRVMNNKYFKFDEEDNVIDFDKRKFFSDQPKSRLHQVCKEYGIKHYRSWSVWSIISCIIKLSNINEIILQLIQQNRHYDIVTEDENYIRFQRYMQSIATY